MLNRQKSKILKIFFLFIVSHIFVSVHKRDVNCFSLNKHSLFGVSSPVLLVSLDGARADKIEEFLVKYPNSSLSKLVRDGVKAKYMESSFPSFTFPNHWTLVTGLNIESHGIFRQKMYI